MSVPILEICDLHAAYGRIEVLRGVDLTVPKGAVVALLGPNGAGKSTLVKVISGQKKATSGDIHLGGVHVRGAASEQLALTRREEEVIGLMAQGATNQRIGRTLVISEGTAKSHVKNILHKLGAANRAEAVSMWHQAKARA